MLTAPITDCPHSRWQRDCQKACTRSRLRFTRNNLTRPRSLAKGTKKWIIPNDSMALLGMLGPFCSLANCFDAPVTFYAKCWNPKFLQTVSHSRVGRGLFLLA